MSKQGSFPPGFSQKVLDFETRKAVRAEVAAAVEAGEKKRAAYKRIAARLGVSETTIARTVRGR